MKRSEIVPLAITFNIIIFKEDYICRHSKYNSSSLFCHETLSNPNYKEDMFKKKTKK